MALQQNSSGLNLKRLPTRHPRSQLDCKRNRDEFSGFRPTSVSRQNHISTSVDFLYDTFGAVSNRKRHPRGAAGGMNSRTTISKRKAEKALSSNAQCGVRIGDIVRLAQPDGITERLAKVSELSPYHDDQFAVVCNWLYTREEIAEDLIRNGTPDNTVLYNEKSWTHINERWFVKPDGLAGGEYMLSTKRTIVLWDTALITPVPEDLTVKLCQDLIYNATPSDRGIRDVSDLAWQWMKKILTLRPAGCTGLEPH